MPRLASLVVLASLAATQGACGAEGATPTAVRSDANEDDGGGGTGEYSRLAVTVKDVGLDEPLADFPALISPPASVPTGSSLLFMAGDGGLLPFEVERWGEPGARVVWVLLPRVAPGEAVWLLYRPGIAPASWLPVQVWANGYLGVWHFAEPPGARDVARNSARPMLNGSTTQVGRTLDLSLPTSPALDFAQQPDVVFDAPTGVEWSQHYQAFSIEASVRFREFRNSSQDFISHMGTTGRFGWDLIAEDWGSSAGFAFRVSRDGSTLTTAYSDPFELERWYFVAGTLGGGQGARLYVDGQLTGVAPDAGPARATPGLPLVFGRAVESAPPGHDPFTGRLDEVRLSNVARSAAWVRASHVSLQRQLVGFGPVELVPDGGQGLPWPGVVVRDAGPAPDAGDTDEVAQFSSSACGAPGGATLWLALALVALRPRGKR